MTFKEKVHKSLFELIAGKEQLCKAEMESLKESKDNETKCSAGDKYETGREMMQIELDKAQSRLNNYSTALKMLSSIDLNKAFERIEFGVLVVTNYETYYISIPEKKLTIEDKNIYPVSLSSPIGKALFNKQKNDVVEFQNREIQILDIE